MPNLRSGTAQKAMAETSGTQTDTSSASDELSSDFENYVRRGIADIKSMCAGFEKALDFLGDRTEKLEKRMSPLEKKVKELEIATQQNTQALEKSALAENKLERFSRRNNLRVVGLPMSRQERGVEVAVAFLEKFFDMRSPRVERAHRDGRKVGDKPRHLLIRMLSYQDKHFVLSQQRKKLEQYPFYIIDDLSATDRAEKKKWQKDVQESFNAGKRHYFSAGKWRDSNGNLAWFYDKQRATTPQVQATLVVDDHSLIQQDDDQQVYPNKTKPSTSSARQITAEIHAEPSQVQ
ncbi:uncharacterized protein LOC129258536 [Lytechinus pictus]|uniref:uncharacterized protein LOC129258536 n=1 Tax=Lytechinus pictus TaxID=7653 RepID=UPI0030BA15B0